VNYKKERKPIEVAELERGFIDIENIDFASGLVRIIVYILTKEFPHFLLTAKIPFLGLLLIFSHII